MEKTKISQVIKNMKNAAEKHSPEILIGLGITGMISSVILAVRATPKAIKLIEEKKREKHTDTLPAKEIIKTAWFCYIPSAVTSVVSIACIIGGNSVNMRRNAALAAAYTLSESTLKNYSEKVIETVGERKEQDIRDEISKDKIKSNPVGNQEIILTKAGNTLCYDVVSGRYFYSNIEKLRKAENNLNRQMRDENYISLNDFYYEIGLSPISIGEDLGWSIDRGYIDLYFSSQLAEDGTPCLVMSYRVAPHYDYRYLIT